MNMWEVSGSNLGWYLKNHNHRHKKHKEDLLGTIMNFARYFCPYIVSITVKIHEIILNILYFWTVNRECEYYFYSRILYVTIMVTCGIHMLLFNFHVLPTDLHLWNLECIWILGSSTSILHAFFLFLKWETASK